MITASGLALVGVRFGGVGTAEFAVVAAGGTLLTVASALAVRNLGRTHDRVLEIVASPDESAAPTKVTDL